MPEQRRHSGIVIVYQSGFLILSNRNILWLSYVEKEFVGKMLDCSQKGSLEKQMLKIGRN